jgi:hypothetical protein
VLVASSVAPSFELKNADVDVDVDLVEFCAVDGRVSVLARFRAAASVLEFDLSAPLPKELLFVRVNVPSMQTENCDRVLRTVE